MRNTPVASHCEPQKRIRDRAKAAGTEISMVRITTSTVTWMEFQKKPTNIGLPRMARKFSSVGLRTIQGLPPMSAISALVFSAVTSM